MRSFIHLTLVYIASTYYTLPLETVIIYSNQLDHQYYRHLSAQNSSQEMNMTLIEQNTTIEIETSDANITDNQSLIQIDESSFLTNNETLIENMTSNTSETVGSFENSIVVTNMLDNYYNFQYIGSIYMLESEGVIKKYRVIFDTGSSMVWIPNHQCQGCTRSSGANCQKKESLCIVSNMTYNVTYSKGSVEGFLAEGWFGFDDNISNYKNQIFLLVNQVRDIYGDYFQGIIGLEMEEENKLIKYPVGFYLSFEKGDYQSQINFGGINPNLIINASLQYVPAASYWMMDVDEFQIIMQSNHMRSDYSVTIPSNLNRRENSYAMSFQAIVDSGSSIMVFPQVYLTNLYQSLEDNGIECVKHDPNSASIKCQCPTQSLAQFPTFHFTFTNRVRVTLEPRFFIHSTFDSHICHLLIKPTPSYQDNLIILGNPFMRKYYTVFDKENKQVGMALSVNVMPRPSQLNIRSLITYVMIVSISVGTAFSIIQIINLGMRMALRKKDQVNPSDTRMNYRLV